MVRFTDWLRRLSKPAAAPAAERLPVADGASQRLKPGSVVAGKYTIARALGEGGFGIVYLATHLDSGLPCALKTFRRDIEAMKSLREQFRREASNWVDLGSHPFLVSANWIAEHAGCLFVEMDYVPPDAEGRTTLQDHLRLPSALLEEAASIRLALQFCHGMEHARSRGMSVHRDIKPANILVLPDGTLQISDFGLALAVTADASPSGGELGTRAGSGGSIAVARHADRVLCGTPGYLAPELFRGEPATPSSDVFSFGIVLWQMASRTSRLPYEGLDTQDPAKLFALIHAQQMERELPRVPGPLAQVVARCTQAKPSNRYADFRELREDLEPLLARAGGAPLTVMERDERSPGYWSNKAASLRVLGRHEEALRAYDRALALDDKLFEALINKSRCLRALGRAADALALDQRATQHYPSHAFAWASMGLSSTMLGRSADAAACFDKALAIDEHGPAAAIALCNRAEAIRAPAWTKGPEEKQARLLEALELLNRALAIAPRQAPGLTSQGETLFDLGRFDEAVKCAERATDADPTIADAWILFGDALGKLERPKEAIAAYDRALELEPHNGIALANKGLTLGGSQGNELVEQCMARDPLAVVNSRLFKG